MQRRLLQLPHAEPQNYTEQVGDVLALIAGIYRSPEGEEAHVVPGEGAALQLWILGSGGVEADELVITTITHDHADRVRSYQLLAGEWARR